MGASGAECLNDGRDGRATGGAAGFEALYHVSRRLAQADRRSRTRSGPVAPMAKGEADHPATASGRPGARGGQGMERDATIKSWTGGSGRQSDCARSNRFSILMGDMTMSRRADEAKTSDRARAHTALLEEALKRPGIPEIMRVYGDWRTACLSGATSLPS